MVKASPEVWTARCAPSGAGGLASDDKERGGASCFSADCGGRDNHGQCMRDSTGAVMCANMRLYLYIFMFCLFVYLSFFLDFLLSFCS
jgi:hypothetical protein